MFRSSACKLMQQGGGRQAGRAGRGRGGSRQERRLTGLGLRLPFVHEQGERSGADVPQNLLVPAVESHGER